MHVNATARSFRTYLFKNTSLLTARGLTLVISVYFERVDRSRLIASRRQRRCLHCRRLNSLCHYNGETQWNLRGVPSRRTHWCLAVSSNVSSRPNTRGIYCSVGRFNPGYSLVGGILRPVTQAYCGACPGKYTCNHNNTTTTGGPGASSYCSSFLGCCGC